MDIAVFFCTFAAVHFYLCMKKLIRYNILFFAVLLMTLSSGVQKPDPSLAILAKMTLEEKIAQLLIIRVSSTEDEQYNKELVEKITRIQPGGVASSKVFRRKRRCSPTEYRQPAKFRCSYPSMASGDPRCASTVAWLSRDR